MSQGERHQHAHGRNKCGKGEFFFHASAVSPKAFLQDGLIWNNLGENTSAYRTESSVR